MNSTDHVKILGVAFGVLGALILLTFLLLVLVSVGVFVGLGITMANETGDSTQAGIGVLGGVFTIVFYGVLGIIFILPPGMASWKLLKRRRRARLWGILASIVLLAMFPVGTMIGIYGLWFFLSSTGREVAAVP